MVNIDECLANGIQIIKDKIPDSRFEAEVLLAHILGKDRLYLTIHKSDEINRENEKLFYEHCHRRATGEPSAYITGVKEFMSLEFEVNSHVLIPRPETELLVETVAERCKKSSPHIADICTGSGAIGCSLARLLPNSCITAIDISEDALSVAKRNAKKLGVDKRMDFINSDALKKISTPQKFDIAVSNPPYIESHCISTLDPTVKNFEPLLALDGGNDGLIFYSAIVNNINSMLKSGGELYFEIGSNQGEAVCSIMKQKFQNVTLVKDYAGLDRIVYGQLL